MNSKVYRDAAENVALTMDELIQTGKRKFSCYAIISVDDDASKYIEAYADVFKPENKGDDEIWFESYFDNFNETTQLTRQLALLFMAEITKEIK